MGRVPYGRAITELAQAGPDRVAFVCEEESLSRR
jgi:hypothetical protein